MLIFLNQHTLTVVATSTFIIGTVFGWLMGTDYERYIRNRNEVIKELFKDPELLDIAAEAYKEKYGNMKGGD